jgi:hypothetical protein
MSRTLSDDELESVFITPLDINSEGDAYANVMSTNSRQFDRVPRERAVSAPSPAETRVTRIRLSRRFTPDKTSSVVDVGHNTGFICACNVRDQAAEGRTEHPERICG